MAAPRAPDIHSIADHPRERLWEYQLRREMNALLDRLNSIGAERDKQLENVHQQLETAREMNNAALAKIAELDRKVIDRNNEVDAYVEELQRCMEQLQSLRNELKPMQRTRTSDEEREDVVSGGTFGLYSSSFVRGRNAEDESRSSIGSPAARIPSRQPRGASNRKSSYLRRDASITPYRSAGPNPQIAGSSNTAAKDIMRKPEHPATTVPFSLTADNRKRPTATRPTNAEPPRPAPMIPRYRSRSMSGELGRFPALPPPAPRQAKTPKLFQDRRPLKAYYHASTAIHMSLGLDGGQPEFDFISSFIAGITKNKERERLLDSLANFCACDTKEDGTREILCDWDAVMVGLEQANLIGIQSGVQDKGKGKAVMSSAEVPDAVASKRRSTEVRNPYTAENPAASSSRVDNSLRAPEHPAGARGRWDMMEKADRSGSSGKTGGSKHTAGGTARHEPIGTAAKHGQSLNTSGISNQSITIEKPGPSNLKAADKGGKGKGNGARKVADRPAPKRGKAAAPIDDPPPALITNGSDSVARAGATQTSRRGLPRAAKR